MIRFERQAHERQHLAPALRFTSVLENEAVRAVQRIPKRHIMDAYMEILSCSSRTTSHRSQFCRFHHREVVALFL